MQAIVIGAFAPYIFELRSRCKPNETITFIGSCPVIAGKSRIVILRERAKEMLCSRLRF